MAAQRDDLSSSLEHLQNHDLLESLIGTKPGDHVCVLYEYSPVERMEAVTSFLKEGLELGERCMYVADEVTIEHLTQWLRLAGVDAAQQLDRGALLVWSREQWRGPGVLDTIRKAALVREIVDTAFKDGYAGVRFAVEMTWTLKPEIDPAVIEEWESYSNGLLIPGAPVRAMCLYGKRRLSGATIEAGLKTHPLVLDDAGLQRNARFNPA